MMRTHNILWRVAEVQSAMAGVQRLSSYTSQVIGDVPDFLLCSICLGIFKSPTQARCGHCFCKDCISGEILRASGSAANCPMCRESLHRDHLSPNRIAQAVIDALSIRCSSMCEETGEACEHTCTIGEFPLHLKQCPIYLQQLAALERQRHLLNNTDLREIEDHHFVRISNETMTFTADNCVRGGGTGREFVSNLGETGQERWNKWFAGNVNRSVVTVHINPPTRVHRYVLTSANDCAWRNPAE